MDLVADEKRGLQYRCLHCKKMKGDHKALTFHCPLPGRSRSFVSFHKSQTYAPNEKRPVQAPFIIDQGYMG